MGAQVAVVTGGSRGVGEGIAVGLAEAGWTVHVSGRNTERLARTVDRIAEAGGRGVAHEVDHADDAAVQALVTGVAEAEGRLDLLVNNVWAGPRLNHANPEPLWERPLSDWDSLIGIGLRAHYVALHAAAPIMVGQGAGTIVNITSVGTRAYLHSTLYGISKAGLDKLTHDAALELRQHGVNVVSLWPGLVRTELLLKSGLDNIAGVPISDTETPELQGRVLARLVADEALPTLSGQALLTAELADQYGIEEPGGKPISPRLMFGGGPIFPPLA
ncbi:SDR family NAD(P)-dependent oxidoreductase [Nocardioides dubius]|uniref:SDR family NAD(P)-dependent oxidoreductase n=1 Tax=Nocardioides dubius TaxID=317019 RepID=A0ABP4EDW4_9ACTN